MSLKDKRNELDQLDQQLARLLDQRLAISQEIAEIKLTDKTPLVNKKREEEIQAQVKKLVSSEHQEYVATLFTDIMLVSKQYQARIMKQVQDEHK